MDNLTEYEQQGVNAIIKLQELGGMKETQEQALAGWRSMNRHEQEFTLEAASRFDGERIKSMVAVAKNNWREYKRKGTTEMRPYITGEDLTGISVSDADDPRTDLGMIARNPQNHDDQWYVARKWFDDNYEPA